MAVDRSSVGDVPRDAARGTHGEDHESGDQEDPHHPHRERDRDRGERREGDVERADRHAGDPGALLVHDDRCEGAIQKSAIVARPSAANPAMSARSDA